MLVSCQLTAPQGLGDIQRGLRLYFLRSDARLSRVLLVRFEAAKRPIANLQMLDRVTFEDALSRGLLSRTEDQHTMPPWLESLEGFDLTRIDADRVSAKKPNLQRAIERLGHLQAALANEDEILASKNPMRELSKYARQCAPPQHPRRFHLWFLTYITFGHNLWSLYPNYHNVGRWLRTDPIERRKPGRKGADGTPPGWPRTLEMDETIKKAYLALVTERKTMADIHRSALRKHFGCMASSDADRTFYYHPKGQPFPSLRQFSYVCGKAFGLEKIRRNRYGDAGHRDKYAASKGRYSQATGNIFERVECDAQSSETLPRNLVDGTPALPLITVRAVDVASGQLVGVGFSTGSEVSAAYRMADFCSAIDKVYFARLFGVRLKPGDWPCIGVPPGRITDRGPGHRATLPEQPLAELAPAWSGQSKATVETRHAKSHRRKGQPKRALSNLTTVEMIKVEILNVVKCNRSTDVTGRLTPEMLRAGVTGTPQEVWNYLDARGRSVGVSMSVIDAVRRYLTPMKFTLRDGRLRWLGLSYWCPELSDLPRFSTYQPACAIDGFAMEICVRYAWVELGNRVVEVTAELPLREDRGQLFMTAEEAAQYDERRKKSERTVKRLKTGEAILHDLQVKEAIGRAPKTTLVSARVRNKNETGYLEADALRHRMGPRGRS